jgi:hypothetical protein
MSSDNMEPVKKQLGGMELFQCGYTRGPRTTTLRVATDAGRARLT